METTLRQLGGKCLVSVAGAITIDFSPDLHVFLMQHIARENCEGLTLDLQDVEYLDTSGLAVLLEVLKQARSRRKPFYLTGLRERPRYLLEATHLLQLFDEAPR